MTHHIMNQMGHEIPNMVGVKARRPGSENRLAAAGYMTMGQTGMGMGRMAEMMPMPANSIAMKGAVGPFGDYITSGGMFTVVKVRDRLQRYDQDPGWYQHPAGTVASKANAADLARDGIDMNASVARASGSRPTSATRLARVDPTPPAMKAHLARWGRR